MLAAVAGSTAGYDLAFNFRIHGRQCLSGFERFFARHTLKKRMPVGDICSCVVNLRHDVKRLRCHFIIPIK
jgi:hypothetical protein